MTFDALDLSRERDDDFLAGTADDFRARALERADRLREVSDVPEMGWPYISVERVRPAVKDDADGTAAAKGIALGLAIGCAFWSFVLLVLILVLT